MEKASGSGSGSKQQDGLENANGGPADVPQEVIPFDPLPAYEESEPGPSESASLSASHKLSATASATASTPRSPAEPSALAPAATSDSAPIPVSALAPTVTSPFNFPTDGGKNNGGFVAVPAPPVYDQGGPSSGSSSATFKIIAFPQLKPDPVSPFLVAYAPILLSYGIPEESWRSFMNTISAFLTATVGDRALSHASDVATHLGQTPKNFGKNVSARAKFIGRNVADNAKRGNIVGAAVGLIGGTISLPVTTALGIVGTTLSLTGQAIGAAAKKPRTPQERAATYAAVANEQWLHRRGLHAHLFDSAELGYYLGIPSDQLLTLAWETKETDAAKQMRALEPHIAPLNIDEGTTLKLKTQTLWLVLMLGQPHSSD